MIRRRPRRRSPGVLAPIAPGRRQDARCVIAVLAYRGATTAELDAPVTRLAELLDADVRFVGERVGPVPGVEPSRPIVVSDTPVDVPAPDLLVVPGGLGWRHVSEQVELADWLRSASESARGILAMSTGSLLLASVGRLAGVAATGHWLADAELASFGAHVVRERAVQDRTGRVVTASGATSASAAVDALAGSVLWSG